MILVTLLSGFALMTNTASPPLLYNSCTASSSLSFSSLSILDENFTVLAITSWSVLRGLNDCEPALESTGCVSEDCVHLFERSICGFRVEEIDDWEDEGIDDSEDDVCLVSDRCEADRSYHDHHKVPDPVG